MTYDRRTPSYVRTAAAHFEVEGKHFSDEEAARKYAKMASSYSGTKITVLSKDGKPFAHYRGGVEIVEARPGKWKQIKSSYDRSDPSLETILDLLVETEKLQGKFQLDHVMVVLDALKEQPPTPKIKQVIHDLTDAAKQPEFDPKTKTFRNHEIAGAAFKAIRLLQEETPLSGFDQAAAFFREHLKPLSAKKDEAWWAGPNWNMAIVSQQFQLEFNHVQFTIDPNYREPSGVFPTARGRTPALSMGGDVNKEALVLNPHWKYMDEPWGPVDLDRRDAVNEAGAKKYVQEMMNAPSIALTVDDELDALQNTYNMKVPPAVRSAITKDMAKIMGRRFDMTNRGFGRRIFYPFDSTKPKAVSWK